MNYNYEIFNFLSVGIILILGCFIAVEDIKSKKIKNLFILAGFGAGFVLMIVFGSIQLIPIDYLLKVSINTGIAALVGILIWRMNFWPAGDAKFFILASFLLPLNFYWKSYLPNFPSFVLLVNIFVPFAVFLVGKSVYIFFGKLLKFFLKKDRQGSIFSKLYPQKKIDMIIVEAKNNRKKIAFKIIFSVGIYFILNNIIFGNKFDVRTFLAYFLFFWMLNSFLNAYFNKHSKNNIRFDEIEERMTLETEFSSLVKKDKNFSSQLGTLHPDGLNTKQAVLLREYFRKKGILEVTINKTIPFSIWIMAGVVITLILQESVMQFLSRQV